MAGLNLPGSVGRGFAVLAVAASLVSPASGEAEGLREIRGVFAFVQSPHFGAGRAASPLEAADAAGILEVLERDYIVGLTYYVAWGDLEPSMGEYRWELVDAVLEAVASRGKTMNLGVFSRDAPAWLAREPGIRRIGQSFRRHGDGLEVTRETLYPLDPPYLEAYYRMVADLADHRVGGDGPALRDHPGLGYVAVGGPSNGSGLETFIQVVPADAQKVFDWTKALSGEPTWEAGLARFWMQAVDRYEQAFPSSPLAVALSFGVETGRSGDRTAGVAERLFAGLQGRDKRPAVMTLNLTGADWWYPDAGGRNVPRRILGLLRESARAGHPVGLQMIGIAEASDTAEQRARPFAKAMANARDIGADWVEVWVEDLLQDRGEIPARRPWVNPDHPEFEAVEAEARRMASTLRAP